MLSTLSLLQFLIVLIPCHVSFPCVGSHVVVFFVGGAGAGIPLAAGGYQGQDPPTFHFFTSKWTFLHPANFIHICCVMEKPTHLFPHSLKINLVFSFESGVFSSRLDWFNHSLDEGAPDTNCRTCVYQSDNNATFLCHHDSGGYRPYQHGYGQGMYERTGGCRHFYMSHTRTFRPLLKVTVGQEMPSHLHFLCPETDRHADKFLCGDYFQEKETSWMPWWRKSTIVFISPFFLTARPWVNHVRALTTVSKPLFFFLGQVVWLILLRSDWEVLVGLNHPNQVV